MKAYFICVIVRVKMWFVCAQLLDDQTQKYFLSVLLVFENVFVYHLCFESFSKKPNLFC